ncbi:MAG: acetyl esterase, partial [Mycobacterium sp.]|nr:acetyl esterase [Mycobacterium sp.]
MSILSLPVVADTVVRVFAATIRPAPKPPVRFDDVPSHTSRVTIPTRYGPAPATIYYPPSGVTRPPVYVNVHGGGFAVGHPEQDDPWCRYLAARAGVVVVNPDYLLAPRHRFRLRPTDLRHRVLDRGYEPGLGRHPAVRGRPERGRQSQRRGRPIVIGEWRAGDCFDHPAVPSIQRGIDDGADHRFQQIGELGVVAPVESAGTDDPAHEEH